MSVSYRNRLVIKGQKEVSARLALLPTKLRNKVAKAAENKVVKYTVKQVRSELAGTIDTFRKLVTPGRELKQKTLKGRTNAAARQAIADTKKAIGKRTMPRSKMRNKNIFYVIVGPRAGFKVRHMLNSKREHVAASTAARRVERGTDRTTPNPFTRRVLDRSGLNFRLQMIGAARELLTTMGH